VNDAGNVSLELRTPFAYMRDLTDEIRTVKKQSKRGQGQNKTASITTGGSPGACSSQLQSCGENESQSERFSPTKPSEYLRNIAFPQCVKFTRFSNINFQLAAR
jgi:hypothetical protein